MQNSSRGGESGHIVIQGDTIRTPRLRLRPWRPSDAEAAYLIYGDPAVFRWLTPAMHPPAGPSDMRATLERWAAEGPALEKPHGRWAIELVETSSVVGGASLLPLPPGFEDTEISWQLAPAAWGAGIAAEAGHALAHYAFCTAEPFELFAVARPRNKRGIATARRVGMEWVGRTDKYYGLSLEVYRIRAGELAAVDDPTDRPTGSDQVTYRKNEDVNAYEAITEAQIVGRLDYRRRNQHTVLTHTVVSPSHRGRGIASGLVKFALDDLSANHATLTNYCPFIDDFLVAHPKYASLLAAEKSR